MQTNGNRSNYNSLRTKHWQKTKHKCQTFSLRSTEDMKWLQPISKHCLYIIQNSTAPNHWSLELLLALWMFCKLTSTWAIFQVIWSAWFIGQLNVSNRISSKNQTICRAAFWIDHTLLKNKSATNGEIIIYLQPWTICGPCSSWWWLVLACMDM